MIIYFMDDLKDFIDHVNKRASTRTNKENIYKKEKCISLSFCQNMVSQS